MLLQLSTWYNNNLLRTISFVVKIVTFYPLHFSKHLYSLLLLLPWLLFPGVSAEILIPAPPKLAASSSLLMDFDSGHILAEVNADQRVFPASLTKIMTGYVAFHELASGNLKLDDLVTISEKAWRTGGSRMFVEVNKQVSVEDLLKGMIIQSGNDASVAIAEYLAGDEPTFAALMNQHSMRLGMENTHSVNSTGLHHPDHYSTARDLALLTRAMIKEFPQYYEWYAIKEYTFNNIKQYNRNKLLWRDEAVDGVKTGYTEDAGYCLVASAKRDAMRLISVVMDTKSIKARINDNQALLNYGFRFFETHKLYAANEILAKPKIWKGETDTLQLGLDQDLYVTIPRRYYKSLKATMEIDNHISAPIGQGDILGTVNIKLGTQAISTKPLVALRPVPKGSILQRLYDEALLMLK